MQNDGELGLLGIKAQRYQAYSSRIEGWLYHSNGNEEMAERLRN
jgi:hypothetical protein